MSRHNSLVTGGGRRRSSWIPSFSGGESPVEAHVVPLPDEVVRRASIAQPNFEDVQEKSKHATHDEKRSAILRALGIYRKAVIWAGLISLALVMEGYDVIIIPGFYALPAFNSLLGDRINASTGIPFVSAPWRSGISNGQLSGMIIGLIITGFVQERFGYRKCIAAALILVTAFTFITFFVHNLTELLIGEILLGIPWGAFQTMTTAYASEVTPVRLRPYLTTYTNLCWVFGQLIGSAVLRGLLYRTDEWAYRIPLGLQWIWPIPLFILVIFAPESPWWLVRRGRLSEARQSMLRLTTVEKDSDFDIDKTLSMMEHTTAIEKEMHSGTSYLDCFKGSNLRRTEIVCVTWIIQTICGSTLMNYSSLFYEQAGLPTVSAFDLTIGQYGIGIIGVFVSWFLMGFMGRRTLYLGGASILFVLLIIIGCLATRQDRDAYQWAIGSMLLVFTFVYDATIGPVCYSLVAELPSTRLKAKSIVLARAAFCVVFLVNLVITNYQLASDGWNWGAYSGFFWAGPCFFSVVWIYFRLPEPKDRSYGELDVLFDHKVSARKFKYTEVDLFRGDAIVRHKREGDDDGEWAEKKTPTSGITEIVT